MLSSEEYKELSKKADKGDKHALRELFNLADKIRAEGSYQQAAEIFRDTAISYRISAFRNLARAEQAESESAWLKKVEQIYQRWLEGNLQGMRSIPYVAAGVDAEIIRKVIVDQLITDPDFQPVFGFLYAKLADLGMEFYSPGGSIQRKAIYLLLEIFGLSENGYSEYLKNIDVRVGLDLISDEIINRSRQE